MRLKHLGYPRSVNDPALAILLGDTALLRGFGAVRLCGGLGGPSFHWIVPA